MADTYAEVLRRAEAARAEAVDLNCVDGLEAPVRRQRRPRRRPQIDFVPFPPTSLPHRDLLLLEQLEIGEGDRVCEIGVGSGATAARVARLGPDEVMGLDVSEGAVEAIRDLERRFANLRLGVVDVTDGEAVKPLASRFNVVFSCDTLEHVADPEAYFRAIAAMLAPGGRFFITFPNEPPEVMHGITRFGSAAELEDLARRAGLVDLELGAAKLSARAAAVVNALGWRPLRLVRGVINTLRRPRGGDDGAPAQRFEETSFHRYRWLWRTLSPAVNLYWYGLLQLMAAQRPAFDLDWGFRRTPFEHCQVVIRGMKSVSAPWTSI